MKTIAQSISDIKAKRNNNIGAISTRGILPRDFDIDQSTNILAIRSQPNYNKTISGWHKPKSLTIADVS